MKSSLSTVIELEVQTRLFNDFKTFVLAEGFIEAVDTCGNFALGKPLFYKKVSEKVHLIFVVPTYNDFEQYGFNVDFWKVRTSTSDSYLKSNVKSSDVVDLCLNFTLKQHMGLYLEISSLYTRLYWID